MCTFFGLSVVRMWPEQLLFVFLFDHIWPKINRKWYLILWCTIWFYYFGSNLVILRLYIGYNWCWLCPETVLYVIFAEAIYMSLDAGCALHFYIYICFLYRDCYCVRYKCLFRWTLDVVAVFIICKALGLDWKVLFFKVCMQGACG